MTTQEINNLAQLLLTYDMHELAVATLANIPEDGLKGDVIDKVACCFFEDIFKTKAYNCYLISEFFDDGFDLYRSSNIWLSSDGQKYVDIDMSISDIYFYTAESWRQFCADLYKAFMQEAIVNHVEDILWKNRR